MINWTDYIAANNPQGVNAVLNSYGFPEAGNEQELSEAISFLIEEKGDSAFEQIFRNHPDYDMIVEMHKRSSGFTQTQTPIVQSAPKVSAEISKPFLSESVKEILTIVLLFWLVNKVIS